MRRRDVCGAGSPIETSERGNCRFYHDLACSGDMHRPDPLVCRETKAACEDLIRGWRPLIDEDKAYVRKQVGALDDGSRP